MVTAHEYGKLLVRVNRSLGEHFVSLDFAPGMGFAERQKWWSAGLRSRAHEGVDICCYQDRIACRCLLGAHIRVPFFCQGKVIAITPDFHGHSVFVRVFENPMEQRLVVYAHVLPLVCCGATVAKGEVAGLIAPSPGTVPPHLHLSLLRGCGDFPPQALEWRFLNRCPDDFFLNPFVSDQE
ncbi:MAG: hypothetical protein ACOY4H_15395 [Thermodesulfobacteriota bacterium]